MLHSLRTHILVPANLFIEILAGLRKVLLEGNGRVVKLLFQLVDVGPVFLGALDIVGSVDQASYFASFSVM